MDVLLTGSTQPLYFATLQQKILSVEIRDYFLPTLLVPIGNGNEFHYSHWVKGLNLMGYKLLTTEAKSIKILEPPENIGKARRGKWNLRKGVWSTFIYKGKLINHLLENWSPDRLQMASRGSWKTTIRALWKNEYTKTNPLKTQSLAISIAPCTGNGTRYVTWTYGNNWINPLDPTRSILSSGLEFIWPKREGKITSSKKPVTMVDSPYPKDSNHQQRTM